MTQPPYLLALDLGTSSVRASLYDALGEPVPGAAVAEAQTPRTTPDGGVELDADELVERALRCVEGVLAQAVPRAGGIAGVGVCTFWHSVLGVGGDGRPVTPILTWADTRSVAQVSELRHRLDERAVHARTGCRFHTSYLPARLLWAATAMPAAFRRARWWLSPGEYLFLRLFGETGCSHSMASGTGLFCHATLDWDEEVLAALPIARDQLAPIVDADRPFRGLRREFAQRLPALQDVPWFPALGDGACSNLGCGGVTPDRPALMVGTSGALRSLRTTGEPRAPFGLWCYRVDRRRYLIGGALSNAGNLYAWLRRTLRLPDDDDALEAALAALPPDGHGLTLLPFLAGERSPGWRGDARAAIAGLSWATEPIHLLRAGLEAVAHRFALIHTLLRPGLPAEHEPIATGGGLLASPVWQQIMADAIGRPLWISAEPEASSRGAALMALESAGILPAVEAARFRFVARRDPDPEAHRRYLAARERQAQLYERLLGPLDAG